MTDPTSDPSPPTPHESTLDPTAGPTGRRSVTALGIAVLAVLAYVPALLSSPGRMPADTKLYLYLDPGGLVGRAASTFEPDQFAGWVPHQQITYLWPSGPWFWAFDVAGLPDWVAHRLWIGTILFAAGGGVMWAARKLGLDAAGAAVAGLLYALSPYLLAYISRTSLLLLPWAAVGWIVGLTALAVADRRPAGADRLSIDAGDRPVDDDRAPTAPAGWRQRLLAWRAPAAIALVVATVGSVNATALALIVPAPALWLLHAARLRLVPVRVVVGIAVRTAVLCVLASAWWVAMLVVQAAHGAPVLSFSETLEDVSRNSTGSEVLRTLGYWLFYQRDLYGPTTTASYPYLVSTVVITVSFVVVLVGLVGLTAVTWRHRAFAATCVAAGAVLAVGFHPFGSPSPLMSLIGGDDGSGLALALRSSTRAVPVMAFGVALGAGALVSALPAVVRLGSLTTAFPARLVAAGALTLLLVVNLPVLRQRGLVDVAIDRDMDPPAAWVDAAAAIDERATGGRVLQLPGAEFGAFRWGYTADQPLVGLADTPLVTRDLLPLGSAGAMDLLYALDDRLQEGIGEPQAFAPVARLLGSSTVLLTNDAEFERYRTARPELVTALLTGAEAVGLSVAARFGEPVVMEPSLAMLDPTALDDPRVGAPIEPLVLLDVDDPVGVVRAKSDLVVVSGSGDGVVDAAAAGLLDGHELLRYSASLDGDELREALEAARLLVVTDANRDRAHHWRGSQDVHGHTESGGPGTDVLDDTPADQRLDVFETDDPSTQTVAVHAGPVQATASAYGEPFAYRPEDRAVMAIDGDPATAWTVGDHGDPVGERIRVEVVGPGAVGDTITLQQPGPPPGGRAITAVTVTVDDGDAFTVDLDVDPATGTSTITDDRLVGASTIELRIDAVSAGDPGRAASRGGVGFAEIDLGLGPTTEIIRVPTDALAAAAGVPLEVVLTRLRADPLDPWRDDPEPVLRRSLTLPDARTMDATVTLRLDARADDGAIDEPARRPARRPA